MKPLLLVALLLSPPPFLRADDPDEIEPCSFVAHTPRGTVSGKCTTQVIETPGFREYWKLTLTFDQQSVGLAAKLRPSNIDGSAGGVSPSVGERLLGSAEQRDIGAGWQGANGSYGMTFTFTTG